MQKVKVTVQAMRRVNSYTSTPGEFLFSMNITAVDALSAPDGACWIAREFAKELGHNEVAVHYQYC